MAGDDDGNEEGREEAERKPQERLHRLRIRKPEAGRVAHDQEDVRQAEEVPDHEERRAAIDRARVDQQHRGQQSPPGCLPPRPAGQTRAEAHSVRRHSW